MNIAECIKREKLYSVFANNICNEYSLGEKNFLYLKQKFK